MFDDVNYKCFFNCVVISINWYVLTLWKWYWLHTRLVVLRVWLMWILYRLHNVLLVRVKLWTPFFQRNGYILALLVIFQGFPVLIGWLLSNLLVGYLLVVVGFIRFHIFVFPYSHTFISIIILFILDTIDVFHTLLKC